MSRSSFVVWRYDAADAVLTLRAGPPGWDRLTFTQTRYVELPTTAVELAPSGATAEELARLAARIGGPLDPDRVVVFAAGDRRYFVIAGPPRHERDLPWSVHPMAPRRAYAVEALRPDLVLTFRHWAAGRLDTIAQDVADGEPPAPEYFDLEWLYGQCVVVQLLDPNAIARLWDDVLRFDSEHPGMLPQHLLAELRLPPR